MIDYYGVGKRADEDAEVSYHVESHGFSLGRLHLGRCIFIDTKIRGWE